MRIFFSVGEPSGDLHGANLVRQLRARGYDCAGYGGPKMQAAGCHLLEDLTQYAVMFLNILTALPKFWKLYRQAEKRLATGQYDAVVLIDYPGFNWWIAKAAKRHGVPVYYYGVPQMWAWLPGRVKKLKRLVDHTLCKLPFEKKWFEERGCRATYVGHPYFDELSQRKLDENFLKDYHSQHRPLLTLLPGSRNQEVKNNLEWLVESGLRVQKQFPQVALAVAAFNHRQAEFIRDFLEQYELSIDVFVGRTPELIEEATACLACSGSVSLELMYHQKPSIIVYRLKRWQALALPLLVRCRFITLVNLLASENIERTKDWHYDPIKDQSVPFPEFPWLTSPVQHVADRVCQWLDNPDQLRQRQQQLAELREFVGQPGATIRAADYIDQTLRASHNESDLPQVARTRQATTATTLANQDPTQVTSDMNPSQQADSSGSSSSQRSPLGHCDLPTAETADTPFSHAPAMTFYSIPDDYYPEMNKDAEGEPAEGSLEEDSYSDWAPAAAAALRQQQLLAGQTGSLPSDHQRHPFGNQTTTHTDRRVA